MSATRTPTASPRTSRAATSGTVPRRRRERADIRRGRLAAWVAVVVIGAFALLPTYWLLVTALTPNERLFAFPPKLVPTEVTLAHFRALADNPQLLGYLRNSVIVSVTTAVLTVVVSAFMGYSFAKYRYRGRRSLMYFVLSSQLFPQALLLVTLYAVFSAYGLLNTYTALVLSFTTFTLPLCVWMLKNFFDNVPDTLIEAARIDGASQFRVLWSIVLPISTPGLVAAGLFAFVRGWNDFIFALTLAGPEKQTLPPGLVSTYLHEYQAAWGDLMAASVVVSLPVVVGFMVLQRYLVSGLAAGAVKG